MCENTRRARTMYVGSGVGNDDGTGEGCLDGRGVGIGEGTPVGTLVGL